MIERFMDNEDKKDYMLSIALDLLSGKTDSWEAWDPNSSNRVAIFLQLERDENDRLLMISVEPRAAKHLVHAARLMRSKVSTPSFFFIKNDYVGKLYTPIRSLGKPDIVADGSGWVAIHVAAQGTERSICS